MKSFCFTVDDNIRFFKEITENCYKSIFEHPYLAMYKRLHEKFGVKVQLNLFYLTDGFDLSQMSDNYKYEWEENADWLKLSFHSKLENVRPYEFSDYREVYEDCKAVNDEIIRFAGSALLAQTTTVHYCQTTKDGVKALADNNLSGLLGLFGDETEYRTSYGIDNETAGQIRNGNITYLNGIAFAPIDIILNLHETGDILERLSELSCRDSLWVMIHEQYFYEDYLYYLPDFEDRLIATFSYLTKSGYQSKFFQELI